ncbi:MAG: hypothetical protein GY941_09600 [Planctomycetes bacterium]|nr:hypothetical protein [Planctomycetota bacterium]
MKNPGNNPLKKPEEIEGSYANCFQIGQNEFEMGITNKSRPTNSKFQTNWFDVLNRLSRLRGSGKVLKKSTNEK